MKQQIKLLSLIFVLLQIANISCISEHLCGICHNDIPEFMSSPIVCPYNCPKCKDYPYGHTYHKICIDPWIATPRGRTCPLCQHELRPEPIYPQIIEQIIPLQTKIDKIKKAIICEQSINKITWEETQFEYNDKEILYKATLLNINKKIYPY